ncbi:diguanylate cyclase (GGDEF domain) [Sulfurimonas denitrificans DSM 1251]|uniref:diguanylate cyclase n=1 Tax=Sulfurimonas denitrificans (strain ATCC 33889 / DSM 1251) TaxID=326298 RepID=Q30SL4_SULDN|nr:GGDEF domain-containing protein [Sulfurimonas denitrificans]ABB44017.1 diguanylate cyclase (GGDEF domain) [Sulfurimonas denitrificans DSM 1251]MDD3443147.1 GGDEF domain-containing protein [Sulfurimonas denitrificans]
MQQANKKLLQIISNETKNSIKDMDVVTPAIYTEIFSKFALSHDTDITQESKIAENLLSQKITLLTNLQESTSNNAKKLSENTDKALLAIKEKNESTLKDIFKETQELQREIERLKKSVYKDELTNVHNRKWLHDYCLEDDSQNFKESGTLVITDLNYFKIINDTYGHIIGDKVLIYIAGQLKKTKESVVRYGGDEFIVIFNDSTSTEDVSSIMNKIREDVIKKSLFVKESSFKVSFSFGSCRFNKGDLLSDVIESADNNMYQDKLEIKKRVTGI